VVMIVLVMIVCDAESKGISGGSGKAPRGACLKRGRPEPQLDINSEAITALKRYADVQPSTSSTARKRFEELRTASESASQGHHIRIQSSQ